MPRRIFAEFESALEFAVSLETAVVGIFKQGSRLADDYVVVVVWMEDN